MSDALARPMMLVSPIGDGTVVVLSFSKPVVAFANINLGISGVTLLNQQQVAKTCITQKYSGSVAGKGWSASPPNTVLADYGSIGLGPGYGQTVTPTSGTFTTIYDPPFQGCMTFRYLDSLLVYVPQITWASNGFGSSYSNGVFQNGGAAPYIEDPASDAAIYAANLYDASEGPAVSWPPPWDPDYVISEITVTNGGSGYSSPPTVEINGGNPTGTPMAVATLGTGANAGKVVAVTMTSSWQGGPTPFQQNNATISFSGGGGVNAAAAPVMVPATYFTDDPGLGYKLDLGVNKTFGTISWQGSVLIIEIPLAGGGGSGTISTGSNSMPAGSSDWQDVNGNPLFSGIVLASVGCAVNVTQVAGVTQSAPGTRPNIPAHRGDDDQRGQLHRAIPGQCAGQCPHRADVQPDGRNGHWRRDALAAGVATVLQREPHDSADGGRRRADTVKFAVTSMVDRTTILWEVTGTVLSGGLSVSIVADDTNTGILPPAGWYWYLVDVSSKLRIGEGPLTLEPGPLVT